MKIHFVPCPWRRCLEEVKKGRADFITSAAKTTAREAFLHFIEPPYILKETHAFYILSGSDVHIQKYEDLYNYKIGVTRGAIYFPRFDEDTKIKKHIVAQDNQRPKMLIVQRIDAFIGKEEQIDYMVKMNGYKGKIIKSPYKNIAEKYPSYMALSKKSRHVKLIPQLSKVMKQLVNEKKVNEIMKKYRLE